MKNSNSSDLREVREQPWIDTVSRETRERLEIYHALLLRWQNIKNLISRNSTADIWTRHFEDSAQLLGEGIGARNWLDMGSGGGFPGLVIAILLAEAGAEYNVHLVESDNRKCAFLREVSRETGVRALVHCARIEEISTKLNGIEVVTARALAPLETLLQLSMPFLENGAKCLFLKGQDVDRELKGTAKYSRLNIDLKPSKTDPDGRIVIVSHQNTGTN